MKDEELLAEEYICNGKCQDDITRNYVHCKTCTRIKDFLTGLKAGRPQWHDLRKDPNDLPKEYDTIRESFGIYPKDETFHTVLNQDGEYVHCFSGTWYYIYEEDSTGETMRADVIAWCEIPTFNKE